jgi:DNA replication protein DnaC
MPSADVIPISPGFIKAHSPLPPVNAYPEWYELFQRKPLVDALLDRLQHHCITLRLTGSSLRVAHD